MAWPGAALYEATVRHTRTHPVKHAFSHDGYYWLIDLDRPPAPRWPLSLLVGFEARDHGAVDSAGSMRGSIDGYLAASGVDIEGGKVWMLAHARVLGHVFNPLTVYWCHRPDGELACIVAEVHNTHGGRHRYLLRPDAAGDARVAKSFYVSPFNPVDGEYHLHLPEPGDRLAASVTLHRPGVTPFTASVTGRRRPADASTLLLLALRHPITPLMGALRIRLEGIRLWLRGLRVVPPPTPGGPGSGNASSLPAPDPVPGPERSPCPR